MAWAGISMARKTDLHVLREGLLTCGRYGDRTLYVHMRPNAGAIGDNFLLMDDKALPHRARVIDDYLQPEKNRAHGSVSHIFGSKSDCHCWDMLQIPIPRQPASVQELEMLF